MAAQERACRIEGLRPLVEHRGEALEDVRDEGRYGQLDRDVIACGAGCEAQRVVEDDLVRADLDEQRRKAVEVGVWAGLIVGVVRSASCA